MADSYGLYVGEPTIIKVKIDSSTTAIDQFDHLTVATAGYYKKAAEGDTPACVALEACGVPSADGEIEIKADISELTIYRYPVGTGTLTQAMQFTTCDLAGARSIDVTASADDNILIVECDVTNNIALVQHKYTRAGVV